MTTWTITNIITLYLSHQHHSNRGQRTLHRYYIHHLTEVGLAQIVATNLKRGITILHFLPLAKDVRDPFLCQIYDSTLQVVRIDDTFPAP